MGEILCFCVGKHREKKAEKMRKVVQSLSGDNSTDTSNADVLYHLYCCWRTSYFNEPQAYLEFGVKAGLHPQVVAALDGCHVPVIVPLQSPEDYVNWKGFQEVTLQGLVDSNYRFVDSFVGWPAKVHNARLFKNLPLFSHCCGRTFLPLQLSWVISGVRVPPLIVGDSTSVTG